MGVFPAVRSHGRRTARRARGLVGPDFRRDRSAERRRRRSTAIAFRRRKPNCAASEDLHSVGGEKFGARRRRSRSRTLGRHQEAQGHRRRSSRGGLCAQRHRHAGPGGFARCASASMSRTTAWKATGLIRPPRPADAGAAADWRPADPDCRERRPLDAALRIAPAIDGGIFPDSGAAGRGQDPHRRAHDLRPRRRGKNGRRHRQQPQGHPQPARRGR